MRSRKDIERRQDLVNIASYYGKDAQVGMCIEEMAELIKALNKYQRSYGSKESLENVIEEVADVEIMLEQIRYLLKLDSMKIDEIKDYKINRALHIIDSHRVIFQEASLCIVCYATLRLRLWIVAKMNEEYIAGGSVSNVVEFFIRQRLGV